VITIGVTGGIGMGKSSSGRILLELGVPTIDTDDLSRRLCEPSEAGYARVRAEFGDGIISGDGTLDRVRLGRLVFSDVKARARLEEILHPLIHKAWRDWIDGLGEGNKSACAVLIPLLYEKGYSAEFSKVVAVGCTEATQRSRLAQRGWDESQIAGRLHAQWPATEKLKASDFVVWTEGEISSSRCQWERILTKLGLTCCLV
jgi:dephospho-CoA kinase